MSELLKIDKDYAKWIEETSHNFKRFQIKASASVNVEMLKFYWIVGKGIEELSQKSEYGSKLIESISNDLKQVLPNVKSFSPRNLRYMSSFYKFLPEFEILPQLGAKSQKITKDALMDNIQKFLLELGSGFSFVGREYRLQVGETEQFLDMLFCNIKLKCYVVVEVKVRDFKPEDMGQISTYVSCVNHILKNDSDNQTIGILICKNKDNVLAKYAVETQNEPVAISEYELSKLFPKDFKSSMPTIEEIERELK